jgi:hypothetical protein
MYLCECTAGGEGDCRCWFGRCLEVTKVEEHDGCVWEDLLVGAAGEG